MHLLIPSDRQRLRTSSRRQIHEVGRLLPHYEHALFFAIRSTLSTLFNCAYKCTDMTRADRLSHKNNRRCIDFIRHQRQSYILHFLVCSKTRLVRAVAHRGSETMLSECTSPIRTTVVWQNCINCRHRRALVGHPNRLRSEGEYKALYQKLGTPRDTVWPTSTHGGP